MAEARTTTGHIDLTRLGKLVMAAYQGMERDRRRTNRSISLMAKERERHLSDRERAAELLRVQKRQLDTALNNMRHGLLMFDPDSRVVVINQSYLKMYGLSPEQAKPGCTARELLELRRLIRRRSSSSSLVASDCSPIIRRACSTRRPSRPRPSTGRLPWRCKPGSYSADGVVKGWRVSAQINEATGRAEGGAPNISGMDRAGSGDPGRIRFNREGPSDDGGRADGQHPDSVKR